MRRGSVHQDEDVKSRQAGRMQDQDVSQTAPQSNRERISPTRASTVVSSKYGGR